MSSGTPSRAEEKARKVRSLLASYYTPNPESPTQLQRESRTDVTTSAPPSPDKDPRAAAQRILKTAHLSELITKNDALSSEVSALDSDMQMLVYENYNKFIVATDTIRAMEGSLNGMDVKFEELQALLDKVVVRTDDVSSRLDRRQQQIEELSAARLLLRRLQVVFELPRKIRLAIDGGSLDVAVDLYDDVMPLLNAHGHKDALRDVRAKIQKLGAELLSLLRKRLDETPDGAAETVRQMGRLGRPKFELEEILLECHVKRMNAILETARHVLDAQASSEGGGSSASPSVVRASLSAWYSDGVLEEPSLHAFLVELDSRFLNAVGIAVVEYRTVFGQEDDELLIKALRASFHDFLTVAKRTLSDAAAILAAKAAGITLAGDLLDGAAERPLFAMDSWNPQRTIDGLYVLRSDIGRLESVARDLQPQDRALELTEYAVRQQFGLAFAAFERRVQAEMVGARARLADAVDAAAKCAALEDLGRPLRALMAGGLRALVACMAEYAAADNDWVLSGWRDVFRDALAGRLRHSVSSLAREMVALCEVAPTYDRDGAGVGRGQSPSPERHVATRDPQLVSTVHGGIARFAATRQRRADSLAAFGGEPAPDSLLLLLAWVCAALCSSGDVERVVRTLGGAAGGGGPTLSPRLSSDLVRELGATQATLMRAFVGRHAERLVLAAKSMTAATDWALAREPRQPRDLCFVLLEGLETVTAEMHALGPPGTPEQEQTGTDATAQATPGIEATFRQMLAASGDASLHPRLVHGLAAMSCTDTCAIVASRALRALAEALRGQHLPRAGFQQVQLDVHFLRASLPLLVQGSADEAAVLQGLDDVLAAAMEHCQEPVLLEPAVLDRILSSTFGAESRIDSVWK